MRQMSHLPGRIEQRACEGTMMAVLTLCLGSMRLNMGAFFSMSGMIMNRTRLPRRKTWSKCDIRPS